MENQITKKYLGGFFDSEGSISAYITKKAGESSIRFQSEISQKDVPHLIKIYNFMRENEIGCYFRDRTLEDRTSAIQIKGIKRNNTFCSFMKDASLYKLPQILEVLKYSETRLLFPPSAKLTEIPYLNINIIKDLKNYKTNNTQYISHKEISPEYLAGFFDGDGSIALARNAENSFQTTVCFTQKNDNILLAIKKYMETFDVEMHMSSDKRNGIFYLRTHSMQAAKSLFNIFGKNTIQKYDKFSKIIDFCNERLENSHKPYTELTKTLYDLVYA
jgi:hypothetical protein